MNTFSYCCLVMAIILIALIMVMIIYYCDATNNYPNVTGLIVVLLIAAFIATMGVSIYCVSDDELPLSDCLDLPRAKSMPDTYSIKVCPSSVVLYMSYRRDGLTHNYYSHTQGILHRVTKNEIPHDKIIPISEEIKDMYPDDKLDCVIITHTDGKYSLLNWEDQFLQLTPIIKSTEVNTVPEISEDND